MENVGKHQSQDALSKPSDMVITVLESNERPTLDKWPKTLADDGIKRTHSLVFG
jgi:hypothetical protein